MCTLSHISLDIIPVLNHLHPGESAAERCTWHPGLLRHVRVQGLLDARLGGCPSKKKKCYSSF